MGFTGTTWGIIIAYQRGYVGIDSMIMNSKQYSTITALISNLMNFNANLIYYLTRTLA